jgi:hypothetical protein
MRTAASSGRAAPEAQGGDPAGIDLVGDRVDAAQDHLVDEAAVGRDVGVRELLAELGDLLAPQRLGVGGRL